MARPGVTYLDVAKAAQQLVAAGRIPTIESIRISLGTGSNSTLGNHLRTWKSKQDQTQQIATKENIPEELIAALKGVWERVVNQSDEKVQTIHHETQHELISLKQELQRLQKDNAYWQQQCQQIKQERDSFFHEKLAIEQLFNSSKVEIAALTEKNAGIEQQNQQKQEYIDELCRQNQQIQANLEHYRNASLEQRTADQQRYEQQQKQQEQTIKQICQELTQIKQEKIVLQQQNHETNFEKNNISMQLDKLETQHTSTMRHLTDTLNELARKNQSQQHWENQSKEFQEKYDRQGQSLFELQTQYSVLFQQSEIIKIEINKLQEQNKVLAHEKWILGQEKAQLYGQLKQLEFCA